MATIDITDDEHTALLALTDWILRERAAGHYPPRGLCDDATDDEIHEVIDLLSRELGSVDRLRLALRGLEKTHRAFNVLHIAAQA